MKKTILAYVLALLGIGWLLPMPVAHAGSTASGVYYHDQSGLALSDSTVGEATRLASQRLGFDVHLPTSWPQDSRIRALWVMDRYAPHFVVIYYGGDNGYITVQLHESVAGTGVALRWAIASPITIGTTRGALLQSNIGGAYPVSELIWYAHGMRYDLLGSSVTSLTTLLHMATSL